MDEVSGDARALGMGGAVVAVADGWAAPFQNPAGLVDVSILDIGSMAAPIPTSLDRWLTAGGAGALHLPNEGLHMAGGLAWTQTSLSGIQRFDAAGDPVGTVDEVESRWLVATALGMRFGSLDLSAAYSAQLYRHQLGENRGRGSGSTIGFHADLGEVLHVGATWADIGDTTIEWTSGATDRRNSNIRAGAALQLLAESLTVSAQWESKDTTWASGLEMRPLRAFNGLPAWIDVALRFGVRPLFEDSSATHLGLGLRLGWLNLEGAWVLDPEQGSAWLVGGDFSF